MMKNTVEDLVVYFNGLKKEIGIKNFKKFLLFFFSLQTLVLIFHYFFTNYMILPGAKLDIFAYYTISGMAVFFSFLFLLSISMNPDVRILNNKDNINLYNALNYLYRNKKKKMSEVEFNNFIDILYEKSRLQDL